MLYPIAGSRFSVPLINFFLLFPLLPDMGLGYVSTIGNDDLLLLCSVHGLLIRFALLLFPRINTIR